MIWISNLDWAASPEPEAEFALMLAADVTFCMALAEEVELAVETLNVVELET